MPRGAKPGNKGNKTPARNKEGNKTTSRNKDGNREARGTPGNIGGGNPAASGTPGNQGGGAPVGNGNATSNAKKAETLFRLAKKLFDGGDLDKGLEKSEAVLEIDQGHAKALNLTAAIFHKFYYDGIFVKAFEVIVARYKRAIAAGSAQAEGNLITFLLYGKEGNLKEMEFRPAASDVEQILAYRKLQALDGSADSKNKMLSLSSSVPAKVIVRKPMFK
jgi:hypothetical protein